LEHLIYSWLAIFLDIITTIAVVWQHLGAVPGMVAITLAILIVYTLMHPARLILEAKSRAEVEGKRRMDGIAYVYAVPIE